MDNQEYLIQHWLELTDEERRILFDAAESAGEFEPFDITPPAELPLTPWYTVYAKNRPDWRAL